MFLKLSSNIVRKLSPNIAIYCLVGTELKKHWNISRSSHTQKKYQLHIFFQKQSLNLHHKNIFRSSCTNFSRFLHIMGTLCVKIFNNLSMIMKNIFDGWFKNLAALYECHQPRHNAYRNRQIIRACFAPTSLCHDHRP